MKRLTYLIGYLFTALWIVGLFFKLMHFPGATVLLFGSGIGFLFIFIPVFLIFDFRKIAESQFPEKMKWVLGVSSLLLFMIASWMQLYHLEGEALVLSLSFLFFAIGFLPFFFFRMYQKSMNSEVKD